MARIARIHFTGLLYISVIALRLVLDLLMGTVAANIIPVSWAVLSGKLGGSKLVVEIL